MNWSRGLFRAWAVLSVIWIVAIGAVSVITWNDAMSAAATAPDCKHDSTEPWCAYQAPGAPRRVYSDEEVFGPGGVAGWRRRTSDAALHNIVPSALGTALGIPLAALGLGLMARWIGAGFRKR